MKGLETLLNPDEHMSDDDAGLHAEQFENDLALLHHQQAHPTASHPSKLFCAHCGAPIPPARRNAVAGVTLCIECQSDGERREFYR